MKKSILLVCLIFFITNSNAQPPIIQWEKSLGGTQVDGASCIQQTTDGGYIVAGYTESDDGDVTGFHGDDDYWVVKLDAAGTIQWQKSLGGAASDNAQSIQQTNDGGYIVAGSSNSLNGDVTGNLGGADYWIVKLSAASAGVEGINNPLSEVQIYPNPATNNLTINLPSNPTIQYTSLIIENVLGQITYQEDLGINTQRSRQIDVASFPNGIYFLHTSNSQSVKFVVQR